MRLGFRHSWLLPLLLGACGSSAGVAPVSDAAVGDDGHARADAGPVADAGVPLTWVDFAVTGCEAISAAPPRCRAAAPAALGFVAIAPAPIDRYLWSFSDGAALTDVSPTHTFVEPGVYDVVLTVAGPGGTAQAARPERIEIVAAAAGARCGLDAQCGPTNECVCGAGEDCEAPLAAGLCARLCDGSGGGPVGNAACDAGQVCADLARASSDAPWRRALCLSTCTGDADCGPGRSCRTLPGKDGGWLRACFVAGLVADVGGSCVDGSGAPDGSRCSSGSCTPLGARGLCTEACQSSAQCPVGSACASFGGGARTCLARCDAAITCAVDPWLSCVPPGGAGDLGFTVDEAAAPAGYCGPRPCSDASQCGSQGACVTAGAGKFCGAP